MLGQAGVRTEGAVNHVRLGTNTATDHVAIHHQNMVDAIVQDLEADILNVIHTDAHQNTVRILPTEHVKVVL